MALNELLKQTSGFNRPVNAECWAICTKQGKRWHIRRIVWGRVLAREERRDGEVIKRAAIWLWHDQQRG